jgi:hypothetical protein
MLLVWAGPVLASPLPTCEQLVADGTRAFTEASAYTLAVTLYQGSLEVAYERSRFTRTPGGDFSAETLERRGLRRPDGAGGGGGGAVGGNWAEAFDLSCEGHQIESQTDGSVRLKLQANDPDAFIPTWTLHFRPWEASWQPLSFGANFTVRVLFIPVQAAFLTEFSDWQFGP